MDTETDSQLASKLQAGQPIWLNRHWRLIVAASIFSALSLFLLVTDVASGMPLRQAPIPLPVVGGFLLLLAWLWTWVLTSQLRLSGTFVETANPLPRRLRLQNIVAARITGPSREYYAVYVCRLTPGRGKGVRWALLWSTPYATNANTLLAELRRRCDLTEVSPVSKDYHTTVWQRPGFDPSPLALEWWQK